MGFFGDNLATLGLMLLTGVAILQQWFILRISEDHPVSIQASWRSAVNKYRRHVKFGYWILVCGILISTVFVVATWTGNQSKITNALFSYDKKGAAVLLYLAGFYSGILRLFAEGLFTPGSKKSITSQFVSQAKEIWKSYSNPDELLKDTVAKPKSLLSGSQSRELNIWWWWFVFSFLSGLILLFYGFASAEPASSSEGPASVGPPISNEISSEERFKWWELINVWLIFVGYYAWVRLGVVKKLTDVHGFSLTVARKLVAHFSERSVPIQGVVIGPKDSGKTCFIMGQAIHGRGETIKVEAHLKRASATEVSDDGVEKIVSTDVTLLDTPGGYLGDHLTVPCRVRTDILVLVINAKHVSAPRNNTELKNIEKIFTNDEAKEYIEALRFALKRDDNMANPFRVRSFTVILNEWNNDNLTPNQIEKWEKISASLGEFMGVKEERCNFFKANAVAGATLENVASFALKND